MIGLIVIRELPADVWRDLLENRVLLSAVTAWLVAQIAKTIINAIVNKTWDFKRLVGDGGMPSAHSATVAATAAAAMIDYGVGSFQFALAFVMATIVIHDATNVRLESSKHAKALNEIIEMLSADYELSDEEKFKELLGHTKLQVFFGVLTGILVAVIMCMIIK